MIGRPTGRLGIDPAEPKLAQAAFYALEDLKLFAEFLENSGGFCIT